jgi:hypothetical protein
MGLFDTLRCRYPLPLPEMQDRVFQTKSLEAIMDKYSITEEGRLILHVVRWEPIPEAERDPQHPYAIARVVPVGDREVAYHGDIEFYATREEANVASGLVIFIARFTEDRLVRIWQTDAEPA